MLDGDGPIATACAERADSLRHIHNDVVCDVPCVRRGSMRGEILGGKRRRQWGDDEKLAIVSAVGVGGATVNTPSHSPIPPT
jgi:hypothetical protein